MATWQLRFGFIANGSRKAWGTPVRVEDKTLGTAFEVKLENGWYVPEMEAPAKTRTFLVLYSYKNIGPREGALIVADRIQPAAQAVPLDSAPPSRPKTFSSEDRIEIVTDRGHIYQGSDLLEYWRLYAPKRDFGDWQPIEASNVGGVGRSAFHFVIPTDENPVELLTPAWLGLSSKLPHRRFPSRPYSTDFGFLPESPEQAVPRLMRAMQDADPAVRLSAMRALQKRQAWTAEHAAVLTEALLDGHNFLELRTEAAGILAEIGPMTALPALYEVRSLRAPIFRMPGDDSWQKFQDAVEAAIHKINARTLPHTRSERRRAEKALWQGDQPSNKGRQSPRSKKPAASVP